MSWECARREFIKRKKSTYRRNSGKASIRILWSDYKLYSQDTGIANIEGKIIAGVSKRTTYVVVEYMGHRDVYKIIVE